MLHVILKNELNIEENVPLFSFSVLRHWRVINMGPLLALLVMSGIGLFAVDCAAGLANDRFLVRQSLWVTLGVAALFFVLGFDYRLLVRLAPIFYGVGVASLALALVFCREVGGACNFLNLGLVSVQPSEGLKLATALAIAKFLSNHSGQKSLTWSQIIKIILLVTLPAIFALFQNDIGTAAMYLATLPAVLGVAGIPKTKVVTLAGLAVVAALSFWRFGMSDYQRERIVVFRKPWIDPFGISYQRIKVDEAIRVSGWNGNHSSHQDHLHLSIPAAHTDFILAVLAEEWGFMGVAGVLILFNLYFMSALGIAGRSRDPGGLFLVTSLVSILFAHVLFNTVMVVDMFPIPGVPLPFHSYGGSFMIFCCVATGLILNVDLRRFFDLIRRTG
ncbi:MAG TPA: FtsW/RodA/SpoVE family cell cycle protein [Candidatus Tectomicrobia bacterium]